MTDAQLTTLSTLAVLLGTVVMFVVLARWSEGGSWSVAAGMVRGVRSWADRDRPAAPPGDGSVELEDLPTRRF